MTVWDLWQFRNSLVHGEDGPLWRENNEYYDNRIEQEFIIGDDDLLEEDKFLFSKYTLDHLSRSDVETKRHWVVRMDAARRAFSLPEEAEEVVEVDRFCQQSLYDYVIPFQWV